MTADLDVTLEQIRYIDRLLLWALHGLTDELVVGPSGLPDWTRGHVLAHIVGVGSAGARQIETAAAGGLVDFYDGGRPARDAAIDAGAGAAAAEHVRLVGATVARMEAALDRLTPEVLDRPTGYRDRPAASIALLWWREAGIHLTDLDLGVDNTAWDLALRNHLADYLVDRVPDGTRLELEPTDVDEPRSLGTGESVTVRGAAGDVIAWLAGREPLAPVVGERGGRPCPLPELRPWP
ncbi:maleylpyruvate isomerase family mycothiol-dependent enzyme [Cellulomonas sp. KRMCY2]|uniref:maleylpyruvate isomerase family mycothiol-dependent enzyme n=1 Tax=Cellulomonas sp. KRMCY2 TaxID=1304865 RepID=UPI00045E8C17|nr:maleylpyruvate isomerase family mycothiol-dependent enzyme [Cellulomonas sp. KRMCY2]